MNLLVRDATVPILIDRLEMSADQLQVLRPHELVLQKEILHEFGLGKVTLASVVHLAEVLHELLLGNLQLELVHTIEAFLVKELPTGGDYARGANHPKDHPEDPDRTAQIGA